MKNLLFIMTDHQRSDSIGMVQCGREVTPTLNRLAALGRDYKRAYSTTPLCIPARTAIATGKYPCGNAVTYNDVSGKTAGEQITLHQLFKKKGYSVGHVGINHICAQPNLRNQNLDFFIDEGDYERFAAAHHFESGYSDWYRSKVLEGGKERLYSNARTGCWKYEEDNYKDSWFLSHACDFLKRQEKGKPFALFLYLWSPHPPLVLPEKYFHMYDSNHLTLPDNIGTPANGEPPFRKYGIARQLGDIDDTAYWRAAWSAHLGLVTYADTLIGRLLAMLEKLHFAENTLTVFTSDHGESLGQHRLYQKMELYEQCVHVPLIIHGMGQGRYDEVVSHLDLMPTLCEYFGLEEREPFDGRSLLREREEGRIVYFQYSGNPERDRMTARRGAVGRRYKYTIDAFGGEELFDLEEDPLEMVNLAMHGERAQVSDFESDGEHMQVLAAYREYCRDYHVRRGDAFYTKYLTK